MLSIAGDTKREIYDSYFETQKALKYDVSYRDCVMLEMIVLPEQ